MVSKDVVRNVFKVAMWAAGAYVIYRLATKDESPKEAVMKTVEVVEEKTIKPLKKKHSKFIKGSPEAKEYMDKLRAKVKNGGRPKGSKNKTKKVK